MIKKENIIFTNLYGNSDVSINSSIKRGDWKNLAKLLKMEKQDVINVIKDYQAQKLDLIY